MAVADIPGVLTIQQDAYTEYFHEPAAIIAARFADHPDTAWIAERRGEICAYLVAYPSRLGKVNPLHASFAVLDKVDCLYLHDLAIHSRAQGSGIARQLISAAQVYADSCALKAIALTAVQGSQSFWARFGFELYEDLDAQQYEHLQTYVENGEKALYLVRQL
jgi:GNAT superfamily N-acetyltransferase